MEQEMKYAVSDKKTADMIWEDPEILTMADQGTRESLVMKAIYFDTPGKDLASQNMTMRIRAEGERYVATLKWAGSSSNGFHEREEINIPINEDISFIKPSAKVFSASEEGKKLLEFIGDQQLDNLMEMRFLRRRMRLNYKASIIELALDSGSIVSDFGEYPIMEMELELYAGDVSAVLQLGEKLASKYSLVPEDRSKFARGLSFIENHGRI